MASVVALIPARAGSKGIPNKNLLYLGGHTLLEWSVAACLKSKIINKVIVSTDSPKYASLAKDYGAEAPFLRPPEISGDFSTDFQFVEHALEWLETNDELPDYIVHIRPTTPFRNPMVIDQAINHFKRQSNSTALRSVHKMSESAYKTFEIVEPGCLKRICSDSTEIDSANNPRQSFPETYIANGYVDVLSASFIRKSGLLHGSHVTPFVTHTVVEIDTKDDFIFLERELTFNTNLISHLFD